MASLKQGMRTNLAFFEGKGEGSSDMPGRRVEEVLTFLGCV